LAKNQAEGVGRIELSEAESKKEEVVESETETEPEPEQEKLEETVSESAQPEEVEEKTEVETAPAAEAAEAEGEEEIEVVEEKIYTIPLRRVWVTARGKRAPRVVRDVRDFVAHHMKAEEVAISNEVNSALWARSINKPPRKITVRAVKDKEGKVIVYPSKAA
jgi:large subunit ribosomal protein L31e